MNLPWSVWRPVTARRGREGVVATLRAVEALVRPEAGYVHLRGPSLARAGRARPFPSRFVITIVKWRSTAKLDYCQPVVVERLIRETTDYSGTLSAWPKDDGPFS